QRDQRQAAEDVGVHQGSGTFGKDRGDGRARLSRRTGLEIVPILIHEKSKSSDDFSWIATSRPAGPALRGRKQSGYSDSGLYHGTFGKLAVVPVRSTGIKFQ
ncbi:hypothetical protein RZS08_36505, partial [Arthrospira platensis SPKY1]|nr:hypothetical protein [Arthrospira platensis SPKY1]